MLKRLFSLVIFAEMVLFGTLSSAQTPQPQFNFTQQGMPAQQFQQQQFRPQPQQQQMQQQQTQQGTPPSATPTGANSEVTTVVAAGDKNLFATIETSMGKIKVELFATITPRTVRNFVELANGQKDYTDVKTGRAERKPFFDGLIFHKVTKGFSIQTGCPYGTGKGGPGFSFADEITPSLRHDKAGMVSMANTGPNTNGSQFFITLDARPELDDKYTIFGQVIDGMSVVRKMANVKVGPTDRPLKRIYVKKVTISE